MRARTSWTGHAQVGIDGIGEGARCPKQQVPTGIGVIGDLSKPLAVDDQGNLVVIGDDGEPVGLIEAAMDGR